MDDYPTVGTPVTPLTPASPENISLAVSGADPRLKTVPRLQSPKNVVTSRNPDFYKKYFANCGPGVVPRNLFFPQDFEAAKKFLRESGEVVQRLPLKLTRGSTDPLATPLSSRADIVPVEMICHPNHNIKTFMKNKHNKIGVTEAKLIKTVH